MFFTGWMYNHYSTFTLVVPDYLLPDVGYGMVLLCERVTGQDVVIQSYKISKLRQCFQ
jgi:hypothetical protein